jgi:hypothetical protein
MMSRVGLADDAADRVAEAAIQFKRRDPERKRKVLELFNDGLGATAIATIVGGTEASVRKIRSSEKKKQVAAQGGPGNPWYESTGNKLEECEAAARNELPELTTDLDESVTIRDITAKELRLHTYPHTISGRDAPEDRAQKLKAGRTWLQERLTADAQPKHQGFVIFPPSEDVDNTCVNVQLPSLLVSRNYHKLFKPIFQSVQTRRSKKTSMGDRKRGQAKMNDVASMAERRVTEARTALGRFKVDTVSDPKEAAHAKLLETEAEQLLVHKVIGHMCKNYNRIQQVSLIWFFFSYQSIYLNKSVMHLGLAIRA